MTERRVPWDMPAYLERVRRACFVCEMLAGAPGYEHDVIHRDAVGIVFLPLSIRPWRGGTCSPGVPHESQQLAWLDESRARLVLDDDDREALLAALRAALPEPGPSPGG